MQEILRWKESNTDKSFRQGLPVRSSEQHRNFPQSRTPINLSELQWKEICLKMLNTRALFSCLQRCLNWCTFKGCHQVVSSVQLFSIFSCLVRYFEKTNIRSACLMLSVCESQTSSQSKSFDRPVVTNLAVASREIRSPILSPSAGHSCLCSRAARREGTPGAPTPQCHVSCLTGWRHRCLEANASARTAVDAAQAGFSPADSPVVLGSAGRRVGDPLQTLCPGTLQGLPAGWLGHRAFLLVTTESTSSLINIYLMSYLYCINLGAKFCIF